MASRVQGESQSESCSLHVHGVVHNHGSVFSTNAAVKLVSRYQRIVSPLQDPRSPQYQRMCENPKRIEKWKALPVILNVSLFTVFLIIGWKSIDHHQHVLSCSANDKNPVLNSRWHGLEFIENSIILKQRNRYQQMIQISVGVEKLKTAAPTPYVLLLIILIGTCTMCKASCEDQFLSFSGTGGEQLKKIFFVLFLICHLSQVTACDRGEYEHGGTCCSLCAAGTVVAQHCTVLSGTVCNPCTAGEYIEHPNGLEKCFKCKTCDGDLGLQIKEECTYIRNTKCEPKKGYYCIENCQMANKHTTCPAGQGVKEKGTPVKDTVCEKCPVGTFSGSDSSTEACKNWTVCEKLNLQLDKPGSSEADVKCAENYNLRLIIPVIAIVVIVLILTVVFWKHPEYIPRFTKRRENGIGKGDRPSPAGNNINVRPSDSTTIPLINN
ncbi:tumor necrosis factor receptor superfamily member 5-like isoform X1 [Amblyraja radiata]|uniref:tumor necrosis factor receptor superfamily member 5-like isoform X1 n=1 Tax=Amblyraja radiata TaxID=386614 RepID=UPI0014040638|nr:tumor necrosis factor receptor superfamily member 5-like isoform X1 [Amblyraja radiata]